MKGEITVFMDVTPDATPLYLGLPIPPFHFIAVIEQIIFLVSQLSPGNCLIGAITLQIYDCYLMACLFFY